MYISTLLSAGQGSNLRGLTARYRRGIVLVARRHFTPALGSDSGIFLLRAQNSRHESLNVRGLAAILGLVVLNFGTDVCDADLTTKPVRPSLDRLDVLFEEQQDEESYRTAKAMAAYDVYRSNAAVQWRFARAAYTLANASKTASARKKQLLEEALKAVTEAKAHCCDDGDLYRWSGIILNAWSGYQSTSEYIKTSYEVREEWLQALALNIRDASAHHLLGRWSFEVSQMPGWKRTLASTLFAEPPSASLSEALEHFERAESISPGFWCANQLWLAQTHERLGNKIEAIRWAQSACALHARSAEDKESQARAKEVLKRLGALS